MTDHIRPSGGGPAGTIFAGAHTAASPSFTASGGTPAQERNEEYRALKRRIVAQGLLVKSPADYLPNAVVLGALLVAIIATLSLTGSAAVRLLCAIPAALLFGQMAFIGHDSAHLQVFRSARNNYILSVLVFNLGIGGSRGWWTDRHNRHHASPNDLRADPDFNSDVLAYAPEQTANVHGVARFMVRHQAGFIGGLLLLQTLNSRIHTARFLAARRRRNRGVEIALVALHYPLYVAAIFLAIGWHTGLAFIAIHETLFSGYLGLAFITNHIGMSVPRPDENTGFLRTQVGASRNLKANRVTDYLFGALTCQIEHHLFPAMPRNNLRRAAPLVRAHCLEHGIDYHETSLTGALLEVRRQLRTSSAPLRG